MSWSALIRSLCLPRRNAVGQDDLGGSGGWREPDAPEPAHIPEPEHSEFRKAADIFRPPGRGRIAKMRSLRSALLPTLLFLVLSGFPAGAQTCNCGLTGPWEDGATGPATSPTGDYPV